MLEGYALGIGLGFASSLFFTLNTVITRRGVVEGHVFEAVAYATLFGIPMFLVATLLAGELGVLLSPDPGFLAVFTAAGLLHFILGRYLYYKAIQLTGATSATPVVTLTQISAILIAVFILGETVNLVKGLGIIISTAGVLLLAYTHLENVGYLRGIVIGLLSTVVFAVSTNLVRYGLTNYPYPYAGLFISYLASLPTLISFHVHRDRMERASREVITYYIVSGITVNLGQLFRYLALLFIGVTVLSPIFSTMPLQVLLLSYLINRRYEEITGPVIMANATITLGVTLVVLSGFL